MIEETDLNDDQPVIEEIEIPLFPRGVAPADEAIREVEIVELDVLPKDVPFN